VTALLWVGVLALGGAGAVTRFVVDRAVRQRLDRPFPFGTLAVNLSGALLLGVLAGLAPDPRTALLFGTAFLGSYTTFSTWMVETLRLGEQRRLATAAANIVVSLLAGLAAAAAGLWIGGCLSAHI